MTSSQNDPRTGFDDSIGGDAREDRVRAMSVTVTNAMLQRQDMIDQIFEFNEKVIGTGDVEFNCLTPKQFEWTNKFVLEELKEFGEAYEKQDMVGMVDAVLDLIYGAMGTMKKMGLSREHVRLCLTAIHEANMTKKRGVVAGRGSEEDAAKPADFVPPEQKIADILFLE